MPNRNISSKKFLVLVIMYSKTLIIHSYAYAGQTQEMLAHKMWTQNKKSLSLCKK